MSNNHSCDEDRVIWSDYLVLKPRQAGIFDIFRLLWCRELSERRFVECPAGKELRELRFRWLVFISVLVQKVLQCMKGPMAREDSILCWWLNLLSSNGGLLKLLVNLIKGEVVRPDDRGPTYKSMVGNFDSRLDLDNAINARDGRYEVALSVMAAKLSYENPARIKAIVEDRWKMKLVGTHKFWNDTEEKFSTKGFIFQDSTPERDLVVVAFKGTNPFDSDDWCTDVDLSWYELKGIGKMHGGFMKALGLQRNKGWPKDIELGPGQPEFAYYTIREKLREIIKHDRKAKIMLAGHSLGGALAILFTAVLILHEEAELLNRLEGVYTFGQPRVGDKEFGEFMKEKLKAYNVRYCRHVYCNDMVPRLPYDDTTMLYKHFGPCFYYNSLYMEKVLQDEPNKNYFSLQWVIPKYMNAIWELIRSFILPWIKGEEYEEGWCMRLFRITGLIIPGLPDHSLQDYDNCTRLGTL
ncbi:hypothetical protein Ancab_016370 [Ancistrocladus abbreviatus]